MVKMVKVTIYPFELIGKVVEIVSATNKTLEELKGRIVDETKMMLKIEQEKTKKVKILLKNQITFKLVETGEVIEGKTITKRPEDRLKGR
tara:strand:+ start:188 stop:457 length:270 start_codon:yes stop_codon:yes gene_type:complete